MILGIDEAGRGPWAGPLVVGAVVLGCEIAGLNDSKKLTKKAREALEIEILARAQATATGWVSAKELDTIGMSEALRLATRRAVEQIHASYHEIIIDGTVNFLVGTTKGGYVTTLPKADALIPSVSAASIIAKVARDRYMAALDVTYPGYGFGKHAGYGVASHRAAIDTLGVTPEHRLSFAPLQKYGYVPTEKSKKMDGVTTRGIGNKSEDAAANELVRRGHTIVERNWKTKYCEIDIVSQKDGIVYFTEVKHRKNDKTGDGLAAITTKKQNQMAFAAKFYVHTQLRDSPVNLRLSAIATTGEQPEVTDYIVIE
jgi:ribonuclease HII